MNIKHPKGVLHVFSIKNFYFHVTTYKWFYYLNTLRSLASHTLWAKGNVLNELFDRNEK